MNNINLTFRLRRHDQGHQAGRQSRLAEGVRRLRGRDVLRTDAQGHAQEPGPGGLFRRRAGRGDFHGPARSGLDKEDDARRRKQIERPDVPTFHTSPKVGWCQDQRVQTHHYSDTNYGEHLESQPGASLARSRACHALKRPPGGPGRIDGRLEPQAEPAGGHGPRRAGRHCRRGTAAAGRVAGMSRAASGPLVTCRRLRPSLRQHSGPDQGPALAQPRAADRGKSRRPLRGHACCTPRTSPTGSSSSGRSSIFRDCWRSSPPAGEPSRLTASQRRRRTHGSLLNQEA